MYQKRNKELEILALYRSNYKNQFYLREISKLTSLPLKTTQNTLLTLERRNVVKSRTQGKNKYFYLNLDNPQVKLLILQSEIYKTLIFLEVYPNFKTFLKSINGNALIVLFGSFSKLTANKDSDVDLLIVSKEEFSFHLLPYKAHKVILLESSFIKALKKQEPLIKEIEDNHIILNNHSSYINIMWDYYGK